MFKNEIRSTTLNTPSRSEANPPVVNNKSNDMLDKLNLYFGYIYTAEELSNTAIPFLLFNLIIRGMNAIVIHCDVLSRRSSGVFFIQNDYDDHLHFSSLNRLPYSESVAKEFGLLTDDEDGNWVNGFEEELYDEIIESPGVPEHVVKGLIEGVDVKPSDISKFVYKLCGVDL